MKIVSANALQSRAIEILGLDYSAIDLSSPEAIASTIRRAATFACPCSAAHLTTGCFELLTPLLGPGFYRETVAESVEALVSYGDLFEGPDITGKSNSELVYVTPPSFVVVSSSLVLLIGCGRDGYFPIPESLKERVEPVGHYRRLLTDNLGETRKSLLNAGFLSVDVNEWLKAPPALPAEVHIAKYNQLLVPTGPVGVLENIRILESERPVNFYPGRWAPLKKHSGRFVARRPQAYGAELWCYLHAEVGEVRWFVDLPRIETRWRGCDEAWHLQQAIDSSLGHSQIFGVRKGTVKDTVVVDFFSPVPNWARRRWDYSGTPTLPDKCLFSYVFSTSRVEEELKFARERMWLRQL